MSMQAVGISMHRLLLSCEWTGLCDS